jgi:hypothetical protein
VSTAAVRPTPSPAHAAFQVNADGTPLTTDTLPSPETYYAQQLAAHGKDLSGCTAAPTPQPGACPKPASLGSIELKQQINVELILDASGSMAEAIGGATKLDTAKRVLSEFLTTLPAKANVALRVYGHKGSSADADKAVSCASSELLYPFQSLDSQQFQMAIRSFQPTGWTPLAASFDGALRDFERFDPTTSSNFVYVVTDGLETCDGDPVAAAKGLHSASVQPIVNIVGFDVDPTASDQLRRAAESGGGKFYAARNSDELNNVFKSNFDWVAWTKYYNCLWQSVENQTNAVYADQNKVYYCVFNQMNAEYRDIESDTNTRFNRLRSAATDVVNGSSQDAAAYQAASSNYDAFMGRVQENFDYVKDHEQQRYHSVVDAQLADYQAAVNQAQAEFDRATRELSQASDKVQKPNP